VCVRFGQGKSWPRKSMNEPRRHVASQGCLCDFLYAIFIFPSMNRTRSMGIQFGRENTISFGNFTAPHAI